MKNKRQFITQEANNKINKKIFMLENAVVLPKKSIHFFKKQENKNEPIYLYDIGFNKKETLFPINNHINKTGSNPLCNYNNKKIIFYDITNIYRKQKNGYIAECFGDSLPIKTKKEYLPTRFLCHHTIAAYCAGFKQIFAYIID